MPLDADSLKLVTINTHQGLYEYTFGVASAPAVFQRAMDNILQGISHVFCDILVTRQSQAHHLQHLEVVLKQLEEYGVHLKREKCQFFQDREEYLGYILDGDGVPLFPRTYMNFDRILA